MDRIPILRMGRTLLVTVQVDMHDQLAVRLLDDLTTMITRIRARGCSAPGRSSSGCSRRSRSRWSSSASS